ncbi:hypothetical protein L4C34_04380 [Vibrio profundum]|uniref:hypothetical protein n=1 Tax=Vibrio profundum TaxID=2910247 RepID=UPI003D13E497
MKKLILPALLASVSFGANATTVSIKNVENLSNVRINNAAVISILESDLVNLPNVTVADRQDQKDVSSEFAFQHTGKVAQSQMNESGAMAGSSFIIVPKVTYAAKTDKSVHFSNFTDHKTAMTIELQIKMLDVTKGTLVYSKNFDVSQTYNGTGNWTALIRKAADKLVSDSTFRYKLGSFKPRPVAKMDSVKFVVADDATIFANNVYVGTGPTTSTFRDNTISSVKVTRPGYKDWAHDVKISKGLVIRATQEKEPKAEAQKTEDTKVVGKVTTTYSVPK